MSGISPEGTSSPGGLNTRANIRKIREEGAAKLEALPSLVENASHNPELLQQRKKHEDPYQQQLLHRHEEARNASLPIPTVPGQNHPSQSHTPAAMLRVRAQSPAQAQRASATPPLIPSKRPYEVEEEPSRLEVEPLVLSKEASLPMRNTQSIPNTPTTPSRLVIHNEASPSRLVTLEPIDIGASEYIIPLAMPARIRGQYISTMDHYRGSMIRNFRRGPIGTETVEKLNQLLCRLANISTHIGLEGGGPDSQEEVLAEQEALYAELSSEKFKLLGLFLSLLKDTSFHISLVVKHDLLLTLDFFLRGKNIPYERSSVLAEILGQQGDDFLTHEEAKGEAGKLAVSVIASGDVALETTEMKADLVVALDESFNAADEQMLTIRKPTTEYPALTPVFHLVGYGSVEHVAMCLPGALNGTARIRSLANILGTQDTFGEIGPNDLSTQIYAQNLAACLQLPARYPAGSSQYAAEINRLFPVRPYEYLPTMDTDSSLSDAMSETGVGQLEDQIDRYFPYHNLSRTRGDDIRHQTGGLAPIAAEDLPRAYVVAKAREAELVQRIEVLEKQNAELVRKTQLLTETVTSHEYWAERRQGDYENLRDRWANLHHDKIELTADLEQKTKEWEGCRTEILSLKGERGALNKEIEALRLANLNHANPAIANAERDAARFRTLEAEKASLQKKNESMTKESSYIRDAYQQASSSAADLTNELEQLKPEIESLRRSKEEFKAWRKAQRNDAEKEELRQEVESYKNQLASSHKMLARKEKQIETLERGRAGVQTRGSSAQPRSPRGGSRGVSPAPGQLGGVAMAKGPSGLGARFNLGD
ncbi:hypothetical protein P7C71_g2547, partial [Lecanoromycetidae sp. Uapishka_2]